MTAFHENLRQAERRLKRTRLVHRTLRILTLGFISLDDKIQAQKTEWYRRHKDLEEYLLTTDEYENLRKYLKTCTIVGTSIAPVGPQSSLTSGKQDYGADWKDISEHIKKRDGYVCQEFDGNCRGPLQVHHINSLSRGGTNIEDNLNTLCEFHHSLKHPHMRRK